MDVRIISGYLTLVLILVHAIFYFFVAARSNYVRCSWHFTPPTKTWNALFQAGFAVPSLVPIVVLLVDHHLNEHMSLDIIIIYSLALATFYKVSLTAASFLP